MYYTIDLLRIDFINRKAEKMDDTTNIISQIRFILRTKFTKLYS